MVGKDSDDNIQKITKLLEKGGTMLATHHECGAPMFRYQGKIVCPVCDSQEKKQIVEPQETGKTETEKQQIDRIKQGQQKKNLSVQITPQSADMSPIKEKINDIIINKVRELTASLENEAEIGRIKDKMECIEQGLNILKLLREQD
ncbi:Sjogren's syndrome/scleroderma autoantigen 1 (Autoantigen p27) [uncultured archaeon]|nr:Sjogren's syndrome/scleroderma autoantigen 1 (Autoantigen p27) [uncultured archaeon]